MTHKELIIEYLVEGNSPEELVAQIYDLLSQKDRDQLLDEIDNRDMEAEANK